MTITEPETSTKEIRVLARLVAGVPVEEAEIGALAPEWRAVTKGITSDEGTGRAAALDRALAGRPDAERIRRAIFSVDPLDDGGNDDEDEPDTDADTPVADEEPTGSDCAPLPEAARIDPALGVGAGGMFDEYIKYGELRSPMTPPLFHESGGLFLASAVVARRLVLPVHDDIYTNLWFAWIARSTVFGKSTGINIARRIMQRDFPHLLLPERATPEALFGSLAGRQPAGFETMTPEEKAEWATARNFAAQRALMRDEMSDLLTSANRDYNAGLTEQLLKLYDAEENTKRLTKADGIVTVRNAYLPFLGASTPAALAPHLRNPLLWNMGWWPRFALLTPEVARPAWRVAADHVPVPVDITRALHRLHRRLPVATWPDPPRALTVTISAEAHAIWSRYDKAMRHDLQTPTLHEGLSSTYGRLPVQALKVAMLQAALDWPETAASPRIELPHLARAIDIVEGWRASAHRALALGTGANTDTVRARVLAQIGRAGAGGITMRDLSRRMRGTDLDEITRAIRQLEAVGEVDRVPALSGAKGGRPTEKFRVVGE